MKSFMASRSATADSFIEPDAFLGTVDHLDPDFWRFFNSGDGKICINWHICNNSNFYRAATALQPVNKMESPAEIDNDVFKEVIELWMLSGIYYSFTRTDCGLITASNERIFFENTLKKVSPSNSIVARF